MLIKAPLGINHHNFEYCSAFQLGTFMQVALGLMKSVQDIFKCHDPALVEPDAFQATLASLAVLKAGYNLYSLMLRYQGERLLAYARSHN